MAPARVPARAIVGRPIRCSKRPRRRLLDLLDRVLSKGVMANGDLTLGVAGVDLIYVRLSALMCAADRVLPRRISPRQRKRRRRARGARAGEEKRP